MVGAQKHRAMTSLLLRWFRAGLFLGTVTLVAALLTSCGGGGGGGRIYLGRSYHRTGSDGTISLSVDRNGRFSIVVSRLAGVSSAMAAQGTVGANGVVATQTEDGNLQIDGSFSTSGDAFSCAIRSGGSTLLTTDVPAVPGAASGSMGLSGTYKFADGSVEAKMTLDGNGHGTALVRTADASGGGLLVTDSEGLVTAADGSLTGKVEPAGAGVTLSVNKLAGSDANLQVVLEPSVKAGWTFMVFMNAANDLQTFGPLNMNQMEKVGSTADLNIVVQWKQANCSTCGRPDWISTRRYYVRRDADTGRVTSPIVEDLGPNIDMGDWRQLNAFVRWAQQRYPAERYALVLWNHGSGWRSTRSAQPPATRAVSIDDSTRNEIQTWQLPQALNVAPKIDLLIMDASLMQMVEVAYEVREAATILVGSQESPPGEGYVYDTFLSDVAARPTMSPEEFASRIVTRTLDAYGTDSNITQSAVALSKMANVASKLDGFARLLKLYGSSYASELVAARRNAESYLYWDNKDLVHYAELVRTASVPSDLKAAAQSLQQAVREAVLINRAGTRHPSSNGLAIYLPDPSSYLLSYTNLALSRVTQWDEWLQSQPEG